MLREFLTASTLALLSFAPSAYADYLDLLHVAPAPRFDLELDDFHIKRTCLRTTSGWGAGIDDPVIEGAKLTSLEASLMKQAFPFTKKIIKQHAWMREHPSPMTMTFGGVHFAR